MGNAADNAGLLHAPACRGGCSWTAHTFFGRRGNNPYCHHRALVNQRRGIRERLELAVPAPGQPFDHGVFQIIEEPISGSSSLPSKPSGSNANSADSPMARGSRG